MSLLLEPWRQALRSLRRNPVFSLLAIAALAVAIGGATLSLEIYDAVVWRDLPLPRSHELVSVRQLVTDAGGRTADFGRLSLGDFEELRRAAESSVDLGAFAAGEAIVRVGDEARRVEAQWVDERYFEILGAAAVCGRLFRSGDDPRRGGSGGVVLTERSWERLFGRDPDVVGRALAVDGVATSVLGVVGGGFRGFEVGTDPALFALAAEAPPNWALFRLLGRLRDGATREALASRLEAVHSEIRARQPARRSFLIQDGESSQARERIEVVAGRRGESALRGDASRALLVVALLAATVLLVLAANLANLFAVRALRQRAAAAIRLALGAPRSLLAATWLAESLLLTATGAALGLAAAHGGSEALLALAPLPSWMQGLSFTLDERSFLVAAALALLTSVLIGALATWEHSRVEPERALRETSATATVSRAGRRWRDGLVAVQVALSVVLLIATGLFVRSVGRLLAIDTGLPLDRVVAFQLDYPTAAAVGIAASRQRLLSELAALPGVVGVGATENPVLGQVRAFVLAEIEGYEPAAGEVIMLNAVAVSPGLLETLGLPLAGGRPLDAADERAAGGRVVVNREFSRRYFDARDPVGRRLSFDIGRGSWSEAREGDLSIVGMVDDRMIADVRERPTPRVYTLLAAGEATSTFYVRTAGPPARSLAVLQRTIRALAPAAAVGELRTLAEQRDRSLGRELLMRDLALAFGGGAMLLAALGLFATLSYSVRGRRREMGLRQALGARPRDLLRHVVADGLRPLLAGLAFGLTGAAAASRLVESQLFGVSARDPLVFAGAALVMVLAGVASSLPAAGRAARVEPALALREE